MIAENTENQDSVKSITRSDGKIWTKKNNKDRFFYPEEWYSFYEHLADRQKERNKDKHAPMTRQQFTMMFLLHTGARINEARHVRVEDIDLGNKRLIFKVTKTKAKKGEKQGKPRIIPISNVLVGVIKRWITWKDLKPQEPIGILSTPACNLAIKKAAREAGIKDYKNFSAHNFRKTLEVWLMALGVGDLKLTAHIGHDIRTAASSYVSPDIFTLNEMQGIREILGDLYDRNGTRP